MGGLASEVRRRRPTTRRADTDRQTDGRQTNGRRAADGHRARHGGRVVRTGKGNGAHEAAVPGLPQPMRRAQWADLGEGKAQAPHRLAALRPLWPVAPAHR